MSHRLKVRVGLVLAAAVSGASYPGAAAAADRVWSGAMGSTFSTPGNWVGGIAPGTTDRPVFSGSTSPCTITSNATVAGFSISVAVTITVNAGVSVTVNGDFTQSLGTFNGSSGVIDISGSLNLSGGTFRASSTRTEIAGAFNKDGTSTFTHNSGVLILNATSSQTFDTDGARFYDLHINDGLRGYWKLDDSASPAVDSSGYGNNLTWQATPSGDAINVAPTRFQSSRSLGMVMADRDAALVAMPSNMQLSLPITLSAWYRATARDTNASDIISGRDCYVLRLDTAGPALAKHTGGDIWVELKPTQAGYLDGTWHHVVGVLGSTGGMSLYYDGNLISSNTNTTAIAYNNTGGASLAIGRHGAGNVGMDFGGNIDDVRVYSRALTAAEINSLYIGHQPAGGVATHTLSGEPVIERDLFIDSGTLAAGTNGITVTRNWWNHGGRFTTGTSGTVTFDGTGTTNVIRSNGQVFQDISVTGSGTWTLADPLEIDASRSLTMNAGTLNASSYALRAGDINSSGGTFTAGTGTVILGGSSSQTLNTGSFNHLRIEDATEANLVGYWKLDEGTGTVARDFSGSNTGTLTNDPKWVVSALPGTSFDNRAALTFDGSNDYVAVTAAVTPSNSSFSACGWMKLAVASGHQTLVSIDGTNISGFYLRRDSSGPFSFQMRSTDSTTSTLYSVTGTTSPVVGTWYHICGVFNGSTATLYVNGNSEGTPAAVAATWNATGNTIIGAAKWAGARADYANGTLDDVRIYNTALTASQVRALAAGRYPNIGGTSTYTLGANATVGGTFAVDSGSFASSTFTFNASSATSMAAINAGTYTVGSTTNSFAGGLTVQPQGTLTMATSGGSVRIASGKTLTIDGTLNASSTGATIRNDGSGNYAFKVGSVSGATPTLNITGLAIQNTDTDGMWINAHTSATTTFTRFDNIAFSSGTGSQLLQIYAPSLYLTSSGCSFDSGVAASTTYTVRLTGNGTAGGETRAIFGGSTCSTDFTSCQASKIDDDGDNNGVGNTPASDGAVVQFLHAAATDTAGSIEGFPTSAFDWNTFAYYSTYVAFHDASGTVDRVYVRDQTGTAKYAWDTASGETIVGTPRWTTGGTTHYLYVALASGKVYRLVDNGSSLAPDSSGNWAGANNPFDCGCTIVSPLALDASNLHWGGTTAGPTQRIWTLGQASRSQPTGSPFTIVPVITSAAPAIWTSGATSYLFMGLTGNIIKLDVTNQVLEATNTSPGSAAIRGRVVPTSDSRVFAGDDAGTMWAIDAANFGGTNKLWSYAVASDSIRSSPFYDHASTTVHFGTDGGKVIALNASGTPLTGYPYLPGSTSDAIRTALLYANGVLVVGTTTGKLFFLDRNNGTTGPALIRQYFFGPTEAVSGVGYDPGVSRYMVTTSDSSANDGRLYYIDLVSDPTPSSS
jgi:hypothetical protein